MKLTLTKLVHSCLIVEARGRKILVDQGVYSWQSGVVQDVVLTGINSVVITHSHPDHLDKEFVEAIKKASPYSKWYGPDQVAAALQNWGIGASAHSEDTDIKFIASEHADLSPWFSEQPDHTSYLLFNDLLISGDCHTLASTHNARVLAGAINGGPWGAVVGFSKMIQAMKERPGFVVPLHDWHWNDKARKAFYDQMKDVMSDFDVEFCQIEDGKAIEV